MSEERTYYEGVCHGGPLHGQHMRVRFPKGFLCVKKPAREAWIYLHNGEDQFHLDPRGQMELSEIKRLRAAEEFDYDVVSI